MAAAITRFRLPATPPEIGKCLLKEFTTIKNNAPETNEGNCTLNPHFFAYGQFPLYLSYISDQLHRSISTLSPPLFPIYEADPYLSQESRATSFNYAIFWLRFWSAVASTLTVIFVYHLARQLFTINFSLLTAALVAFTPALIQSAHFGTTESLLTFCFMGIVYFSCKMLKYDVFYSSRSFRQDGYQPVTRQARTLEFIQFILFISFLIGIALGSKLTGIFFLFPPLFTLFILFIRSLWKKQFIVSLFYCFIVTLFFVSSSFFFIISSPYNIVAYKDFLGSVFGYEQAVATGTYQAFYTRQFVNSIPILFQIEKVFPYALGWPVFILGLIGFLILVLSIFVDTLSYLIKKLSKILNKLQRKHKKKSNLLSIIYADGLEFVTAYRKGKRELKFPTGRIGWIIVVISFLVYLLPNAFLFAKWTRFMTPILPFFALFTAYYIDRIAYLIMSSRAKSRDPMTQYVIFVLCILTFLPGIAFMSIYSQPDSRISASYWIWTTLPDKSYVLSETANVVDIPVGLPKGIVPQKDFEVISFDFYHLDESPELFNQLITHLSKADYIFIPSRRIFANHLRLYSSYPLVTRYYELLFTGKLGFEKVEEFSSYPTIGIGPIFLEIPDEAAEETYTVFDHPVIRIYKKEKLLTKEEYKSLFL
ncbi:glycosyltransferase family 39 protein [Candidatus Gottesmanbacteria bacterium]|nr:glycosyltransferase family 39 protein [Candidatus Gottesmanbacteria bacterium]